MGNRSFMVLFFLIAFFTPARGFAEDVNAASVQPPSPLGQALSKEDASALRQDLQALAQAMDVEVPVDASQQAAAPATTAPASPPAKKTTADVADRALTMVNDLIVSVSAKMQEIAPMIWDVMVRQQYAKAVGDLVVPLGMFSGCLIYWFVMGKTRRNASMKEEADTDEKEANRH